MLSVNSCVVTYSHLSPLQVGWFPSTYVEEGEEWRLQPGSEEHNSNKDSEILQRCLLRCYFSEQSRRLQSPPWSPVAYKSQRPLGVKRATVQCWSKDGPIISGWLCVAKWLHQLAACLSAGHKPLPEPPPPPSFVRTPIIHPPLLSSRCLSPHLPPVSACQVGRRQSVKSGYSNATLPFLHSSVYPSIHPCIHPSPCGKRAIWAWKDPKFPPPHYEGISVSVDLVCSFH